MSLVVLELPDIFAAAIIQKSAFTVTIIMPHTFELSLKQIRPDLLRFWYQIFELLISGIFAHRKIVPVCKGQCAVIPLAILEEPIKGISVLVYKSTVKYLASKLISIEIIVVILSLIGDRAIAMRLIKQTLTSILPNKSIDSLGRNT